MPPSVSVPEPLLTKPLTVVLLALLPITELIVSESLALSARIE